MSTNVFVNYFTDDLESAKTFYTSFGWTINPMFSDDNAFCVVVDDNIFFMVLRREFMATFTDKQLIDPRTQAQSQVSFTCSSRAEVDAMAEKGLAAGGSEPRAAQDLGFMYSRDIDDPAGNGLAFLYMEPVAVEQGPAAFTSGQTA